MVLKRAFFVLIFFFAMLVGCGGGDDDSQGGSDSDADTDADTDADSDGDTDSDVDTDADTDADSDSDTDTDTDTLLDAGADAGNVDLDCSQCDAPACLLQITGRVLWDDGTPLANQDVAVRLHATICYTPSTDENGYFVINLMSCFNVEEPFQMMVPSSSIQDPTLAVYAFQIAPTQEQISDQGPDDFSLDIGTHYFYHLPEEYSEYSPDAGASVDLSGVQFEVGPGAFGEEAVEIKVLSHPLDETVPPFIANPLSEMTVDRVDGLYFLTPHWQNDETGGEIVLKIAPPSGWTDQDTGKVFILSSWMGEVLELPGLGEIPYGGFVELGDAVFDQGKIVTPPIPRLGWIGIRKD